MKVLHVLHQSLPHNSGSTIRSRDIVASQKALGIDTIVVTSPFQESKNPEVNPEFIESIKYYRTFRGNIRELHAETSKGIAIRIRKFFRMPYFSCQVYRIAKSEKVKIIHAHATFYCAFSALVAARLLRIPVLYEVRSLWEQRQLRYDKSLKALAQIKLIRAFETISMRLVDQVIAINVNLKENIKLRGIKEHKISIITNAVHFERIPSRQSSLISKPKENIVFGYIGTLNPIEGLDDLILVFDRLRKKGFPNRLLIYGKGSAYNNLISLISKLGISNVELMGIVPPELISEAYDQIDVIVNPRKKSELSDTVTPLKPLEAMGYSKLVIASDVGGMQELITDGKTGLLFKAGDLDSLQALIEGVLTNMKSQELEKVVKHGHLYVRKKKTWEANALMYRNIYNSLIKKIEFRFVERQS